MPYGWYQLTVGVPEFMESAPGRGYQWVGLFCGADCLTASGPDIKTMEIFAHQAYEPEIPS